MPYPDSSNSNEDVPGAKPNSRLTVFPVRNRGFLIIAAIGVVLVGLLALVAYYWVTEHSVRISFMAQNVLNLLIFIAILTQVYIYTRQWDAMNHALEIERAKTNPRLRIANVRVENFEVGKKPVFIVCVANGGLIDARDVKLHIEVQIDVDKTLNWIRDQIVTIPANGKENYWIVWNSRLEQQIIDGFNNATPLRVLGHFTYGDAGRKNFCYKYYPWEGERPAGIAQFIPCDFDPGLNIALQITGDQMTQTGHAVTMVHGKAPKEPEPDSKTKPSNEDSPQESK